MCHVVLLLPLAGLGVFWLLPTPAAAIVYVVILLASALLFKRVADALRRDVQTGAETLLGASAHVIHAGPTGLIVQLRGTLWRAEQAERGRREWSRGEQVRVTGRRGNTLEVTPFPTDAALDSSPADSRPAFPATKQDLPLRTGRRPLREGPER